ncbi:iron complex outermembrane recepter protein [Pustulibacterium marinum]|uniref:Iron complex outermembrane recepter protein n=1 Tax=Pustulibacterium marinum TaxID=1224947 RepID=A0A1I7EWW1_9FLAO|nr:TonB-dependent receptor [Pustulibacterium marinum]SFU28375.1 iron complex outermembrane recepter protein [Pustulibacterium marinum]
MKHLFMYAMLFGATAMGWSQEQTQDTLTTKKEPVKLDEVSVSATRVNKKTPVTFSNISKKEIQKRNLGQDIPMLMNYLPGVVTTSDAGAGVGYTGIRVRGSDATRVNVTINGVPYNDSESQGTYWVNMPDFASSTESIQLQRGVGTSTNGSGAFGASLNLLTEGVSNQSSAQISNSYGSFNTHKHTLKFSTGLMNDHFEVSGRLSKIASDGYIDRASSDLKSYFLQGAYKDKNTLIKALVFGGHEITYQSWNGLEDPYLLENDRTYNTAGMYYDEEGNVQFYDNEVDNYKQDHAQLIWTQQWTDFWNTNVTLHYTYGRGFYEQYKEDSDFADYGLEPIEIGGQTIDVTDLIRRKWLDNDFYGTVFSANYSKEQLALTFGGGVNQYLGRHFGEIIWARYASDSEIRDNYYNDASTKNDLNVFAKANYNLTKQWSLYADMQYRRVRYKANGSDTGLVDDTFNFFNPKAGLNFELNTQNNFYFSYARAHREPNRTDYENGSPKPEKLNDFELGWRYEAPKFKLNSNVYYMRYQDQLVLTGALDEIGSPIRANSGDSYRLGLELDATIAISSKFVMRPNLALSTNKNIDFYFQRDGVLQDLGNTNISYSPQIVAGNIFTFIPSTNFQVSLLSKYVGEQYMGNIDAEGSKLADYFINDVNVNYTISCNKVFKSIVFSALLNNIFNVEYISNGYFYTYDDTWSSPNMVTTIEGAGYYPQAKFNALLGVTLNF